MEKRSRDSPTKEGKKEEPFGNNNNDTGKRKKKEEDNLVNLPTKKKSEPEKTDKLVKITSNHFRFHVQKVIIYQYHISFEPELEHVGRKRAVIVSLKENWGPVWAFDGNQLFLLKGMDDSIFKVDQKNWFS